MRLIGKSRKGLPIVFVVIMETSNTSNTSTIALFDVDGTLTVPRREISKEMRDFVQDLRRRVTVGIVGGSDLNKIAEQLSDGDVSALLRDHDYVFAENGLVAYKGDMLLATQSIKLYLGEDNLKKLINFILHYIADLDIPIKRGTFIEFRNGMMNVSPIGRNCTQEERNAFEAFDATANVRETMIAALKEEFAALDLTYSIGGQISFDVFPSGWDKTYSLRFVEADFPIIHFFGDKTHLGGNDHEIFMDARTHGHTVTSPDDTRAICTSLWCGEV